MYFLMKKSTRKEHNQSKWSKQEGLRDKFYIYIYTLSFAHT